MSTLFERWAAGVDRWAPGLTTPAMAMALGALERDVPPGARVLDLGCGDGWTTAAFEGHGYRAVGLDVNGNRIRTARGRHPAVRFVAARAERLPFASGVLDAVFSFSVLQFTRRRVALAEVARVLKPGGRLVCVENLRGHALPRLYRTWMRWSGRPYPEHETPRDHLRWPEWNDYEHAFAGLTCVPFNLSTPWIYLGSAVGRRLGMPPIPVSAYRPWHAVDRRVLDRWPGLAHRCWHVLIVGCSAR
jgi:SAM-dependent methyltransferase